MCLEKLFIYISAQSGGWSRSLFVSCTVIGELWKVFPFIVFSPTTWAGRFWSKRGVRVAIFLQLIWGKDLCLTLEVPYHSRYRLLSPEVKHKCGHGKKLLAYQKMSWWRLAAQCLYRSAKSIDKISILCPTSHHSTWHSILLYSQYRFSFREGMHSVLIKKISRSL